MKNPIIQRDWNTGSGKGQGRMYEAHGPGERNKREVRLTELN